MRQIARAALKAVTGAFDSRASVKLWMNFLRGREGYR
jgi:hypothetical protein